MLGNSPLYSISRGQPTRPPTIEGMGMKPTKIHFEKRYSDNSGIEFAVSLDSTQAAYNGSKGLIEFEAIDKIQFPLEEIDWLISCLEKI